jgi:hypothetical protein
VYLGSEKKEEIVGNVSESKRGLAERREQINVQQKKGREKAIVR